MNDNEKPPVVSVLEGMIKTATERGKLYGDSYLKFGAVADALWPDGFTAATPNDLVRMGVIVQVIGKLIRYTSVPGGHKDSAHDLAVYAALLESVTACRS